MGEFINSLDYMMLLKAFVVGGVLCIIAQILIDKTKLTPAKILVLYVHPKAFDFPCSTRIYRKGFHNIRYYYNRRFLN